MPSRRHDEIGRRFAANSDRVVVAKDIARYKARECRDDLLPRLPLVIPLGGGASVTILTADTLPNDDAVKITVSVKMGTTDITPPGLNPWIIANPPMLMPDPVGDVSIASEDIEGNPVVEKFCEDPAGVIVDLVRRKFA